MAQESTASSTRAVDRALALLAEVCSHDRTSLSMSARHTGLPASTALRLLRTLEASGYVRRAADGSFSAGATMIRLGAAALGRQALVRQAEPALQRIVAATGESAYLSIRGPGDTAVYVAMVEGTHPIRHTSWVGRSVPMADLAVGKALSNRVPEAGYVAERDPAEPDVTAIAAPINSPGGTAGALSVIGPTYRIAEATMHAYGQIVRREAQALSDQFGTDSFHAPQDAGVPA